MISRTNFSQSSSTPGCSGFLVAFRWENAGNLSISFGPDSSLFSMDMLQLDLDFCLFDGSLYDDLMNCAMMAFHSMQMHKCQHTLSCLSQLKQENQNVFLRKSIWHTNGFPNQSANHWRLFGLVLWSTDFRDVERAMQSEFLRATRAQCTIVPK